MKFLNDFQIPSKFLSRAFWRRLLAACLLAVYYLMLQFLFSRTLTPFEQHTTKTIYLRMDHTHKIRRVKLIYQKWLPSVQRYYIVKKFNLGKLWLSNVYALQIVIFQHNLVSRDIWNTHSLEIYTYLIVFFGGKEGVIRKGH